MSREPDHPQPPGTAPEVGPFAIQLAPEIIEAIAARAAELVVDERPASEPWIGVEAAAKHLACPRSRIYALVSARRIPFRKDGTRVLFRRSTLDAWLEAGGARRP